MDGEDLVAVLGFLRDKGFVATELALQEEQTRLSAITNNPQAPRRRSVEDPSEVQDAYDSLRTWVRGSLRPYKEELLRVLYPVFIQCVVDLVKGGNTDEARIFFHSFLEDHENEHSKDLHKMKRILSPHLKEIDLAPFLRGERFRVKVCEYSYELLLRHLHEEKAFVMLEMINKGTVFEVCAGQPSFLSVSAMDSSRLFPLKQETVAEIVQAGSSAALVGVSALNLLAAKVSECDNTFGFVSVAILYSIPYTYLPFGIVSAALGVSATKNHRLLGLAATLFIAQCIYILIIGGVRAITCQSMSVLGPFRIYTILFVVNTGTACILHFWGTMSEHPKCLHDFVNSYSMAVDAISRFFHWRIFARGAKTEVKSEADLEMGMGGQNRDQEGSLMLGRSKKQ